MFVSFQCKVRLERKASFLSSLHYHCHTRVNVLLHVYLTCMAFLWVTASLLASSSALSILTVQLAQLSYSYEKARLRLVFKRVTIIRASLSRKKVAHFIL